MPDGGEALETREERQTISTAREANRERRENRDEEGETMEEWAGLVWMCRQQAIRIERAKQRERRRSRLIPSSLRPRQAVYIAVQGTRLDLSDKFGDYL